MDEPLWGPSTVVLFEFEAYPEPKVLTPIELQVLYANHKSYLKVAKIIGTSKGFVIQHILKK